MEWTRDGRKGHGTYEDGNIFIQTVRKLLKKKNHFFFLGAAIVSMYP